MNKSTLTRIQAASWSLLLLVAGAILAHAIHRDPDVAFLSGGVDASWIGAPMTPYTGAIPVDFDSVATWQFVKRFRVDEASSEARIEARGLRELAVRLNGQTLTPDHPPESWKATTRLPAGEALQIGSNELIVDVRNATGPALLQLHLQADTVSIRTDSSWEIRSPDGLSLFAAPARDTTLLPDALALPASTSLLGRYFAVLLLLFCVSAGGYALAEKKLSASARARMPQVVFGLALFYWITVFVSKIARLPVMMGFDIPSHLEVLDILLEQGRLPLATEGWSTYHPPLFHVLTAVTVAISGVTRESAAGQVVYRLVVFGAGLAMLAIVYASARRIFRDDPMRTSLAVAFAALVPMNLYISAYVSNESLQACWVSLALLCGVRASLANDEARGWTLASGMALGLAISTKFTSLILIPAFAIVLGTRAALIASPEPSRLHPVLRGAMGVLLVCAGAFGVGGWFYLRNYLHYGKFIVWNVDLPASGHLQWWEQPGFHTWSYYTSFGKSITHPFFAGFNSFWDGVYSTFWGDGLVAGMSSLSTRHPFWNYDFMTLGYLLALPVSLLVLYGFAKTLVASFRDPDANLRVVYSLVTASIFVLVFSLFSVTFRLPYYAQAKAFYILSVSAPLAIVAAIGLSEFPSRFSAPSQLPLRLLYFGWLGLTGGVLALSFLA